MTCETPRAAQALIISGIDTRCDVHTTVTDNGDGTFTATHVDGSTVHWDGTNTFMNVVDNGDGTFTGTNVDGTVVTWNGEDPTVDTFMTVVDNEDGTFTGTNVDGTVVTWDGTNTFMTVVDNGDGTVTGTNVDGTVVTWDGSAGNASAVTNVIAGNRIASHNDGDGNIVEIDETVTSVVAGPLGFVYTNEQGIPTTVDFPDADAPSDICDLPSVTQQDIDDAAVVEVAYCLDGVQSKGPLPAEPDCDLSSGPLAVVNSDLATGDAVEQADWIAAGQNVNFDITPEATATVTNTHPCRSMLASIKYTCAHLLFVNEGHSFLHVTMINETNLNGTGFVPAATEELHFRRGSLDPATLRSQSEQGSGNNVESFLVIPPGQTLIARTKMTTRFENSEPEAACRLNGPSAKVTIHATVV